MHYLHTMIRVSNLDETLHFFCDLLGMIEISRKSSDKGWCSWRRPETRPGLGKIGHRWLS